MHVQLGDGLQRELQVSRTIRLAHGLSFPAAELATKVTGAFGIRGSGKSSLMSLVCEQLIEARIQVIILDPVGVHWALRVAADGRTPSPYKIPVLGGRHADLVLAPTTGEVVGSALARSNDSCVLDISSMRKGERIRFSGAFFEAFFEGKKGNPAPVLLCLEEAQNFAPQIMYKGSGQEQMLGAIEDLASQGRNFGAGLWLNSLRPQKINKEITSLMDLVFGFRLTGVHERKSVKDWLQEKGAEGRDEIDGELPSLQAGHAFVWSPAVFNIFGKYHLRQKTTYDAGATPLYARAKVKLKPLDLAELEAQMGAVVTETKANDPRVLKARIAELERAPAALEREVARLRTVAEKAARTEVPSVHEKSVLKPADLAHLEKLVEKVGSVESQFSSVQAQWIDRLLKAQAPLIDAIRDMAVALKPTRAVPGTTTSATTITTATNGRLYTPIKVVKVAGPPDASHTDEDHKLSRCARALLGVLSQRGVATDSQISALSGYRKTSSGFANSLSELRTKGFIDGPPERRVITQQGRDTIGPTEPLPTGPALLEYWMRKLGRAEAAMLRVIYDKGTIEREKLSSETGYSMTSSGFGNAISGLRVLELVSGPNGGDLTIADVFKE
jgi:uncharacterized protein